MKEFIRHGLLDSPEDYFKNSPNEDFELAAQLIYRQAKDNLFFEDLRQPLRMFEDATELLGFRLYFSYPELGVLKVLALMDEDCYTIPQKVFMLGQLAGFYGLITNFADLLPISTKHIISALTVAKQHLIELHNSQKATNVIETPATSTPAPATSTPAAATSTPIATDQNVKLTHAQIAIFYHLEGWTVNRNNAEEIARKFGQTSGQKLEETYRQLTSELVRTAKGKYTLKNYKALELLVSDKAKNQYIRELKDVKANNKE